MTDVTLTFPDGAERKVKSGTTGLEVAKSISPSLAKRTVAMQPRRRAGRPRRSDHQGRRRSISSRAPTRKRSS